MGVLIPTTIYTCALLSIVKRGVKVKKGCFILFLLIFTLFSALSITYAETTFFEEDLGYRGNFIIVQETEQIITEAGEEPEIILVTRGGEGIYCGDGICHSNEDCSNCAEDCGECPSELAEPSVNETLICNVVFESLRLHIKKEKNIDYTSTEVELLTSQINTLTEANLTLDQTNLYLSQFEDLCDMPYPLSGSFILGKDSNMRVIIQIASLLILGGILFLLFRERKGKAFK